VLALGGAAWLAQQSIDQQRAAFETDARIVHRLLSQQVVQHDAVLATLALLQPGADRPEQRLPALYPHILRVERRDAGTDWPDAALARAEAASRAQRRAVLVDPDLASGRYRLVLAAEPASHALTIDLQGFVPWADWPMNRDTSPVRVALELQGSRHVLQEGRTAPGIRVFGFDKVVAAPSQPFHVVASLQVGWGALPWARMLAWAGLVGAAALAWRHLRRQREQRQRAEALLRLGQVGRLNALGELAAGMAHELNQPLTAMLANTQAAQRLLDEGAEDTATARHAMAQAVAQAHRAADVVGRLRRSLERSSDTSQATRAIDLAGATREALHLLAPEVGRLGVQVRWDAPQTVVVQADPVALDQIVHNLLLNALQALQRVDAGRRTLRLSVQARDGQGALAVTDSGPGLPAEVLPRVFEPFFTTREGGLGLGLSLSETLAGAMGGRLVAAHAVGGGAAFTLQLPLAGAVP